MAKVKQLYQQSQKSRIQMRGIDLVSSSPQITTRATSTVVNLAAHCQFALKLWHMSGLSVCKFCKFEPGFFKKKNAN